ncbi:MULTISPECIES: hypothetical protein [Thalassobaculum]|uniref:Uncharacterized protein n=1 Tax=Thalassobaculum litoreum DSM 18839 TaxID=1123362 RepID=A0A8G2BJ30_9PROT|nr:MULTISPECIES: hypothetical protein [Thalassobaculum]SDF76046.1 hypothetical protein SAMN05660686_02238 [Thalassobaculum litoreum DSM 18839]
MADIDPLDRRALGVLSETVNAELGAGSIVAREVNRAYRSGRSADLRTASAAFDALPSWQRSSIGDDASRRARRMRAKPAEPRRTPVRESARDSARDWQDLREAQDRVVIPSPPRFLKPRVTR